MTRFRKKRKRKKAEKLNIEERCNVDANI